MTHTIDEGELYSVCLNLDLPNPDNPELIILSGKVIIAALEAGDWVETENVEPETSVVSRIDLIQKYITVHRHHLIDLVDGVPYSDEFGKRVIRRHCENLNFDLRLINGLKEAVNTDAL